MFHSKAVSVISTVLLSASDEPTPARPFFPIKTVLAAINHAPNQKDAKMNQDVLWAKASYSNCPHAICCFLKVVFTTGSFGFRQHRVQVTVGCPHSLHTAAVLSTRGRRNLAPCFHCLCPCLRIRGYVPPPIVTCQCGRKCASVHLLWLAED